MTLGHQRWRDLGLGHWWVLAIGGSSGADWRNPLRVDWEDAFDQEYRMTGEAFVFCDFLRRAMSGVVPSDRTGVICDYSFGAFLGWKFRWAFQSYVNPIEIDATAMPKFDLGQAVFKDKNPDTLILCVRCHGEEDGNGGWVGQGPGGKKLSGWRVSEIGADWGSMLP